MQDYKKLVVWQEAHQLALAVYRMTGSFPDGERYGLTNQMPGADRYLPTSPKGVEGMATPSFAVFCSLQWGRRTSWNISCCWPAI
jgi:hypothetical protein